MNACCLLTTQIKYITRMLFITLLSSYSLQGKKQQFRIESLAALKKSIGDFLSVLGLMPSSYYEECLNFCALNRDLIKSGSYFLFYFQQVFNCYY
jgi:hypothetical protein